MAPSHCPGHSTQGNVTWLTIKSGSSDLRSLELVSGHRNQAKGALRAQTTRHNTLFLQGQKNLAIFPGNSPKHHQFHQRKTISDICYAN